VIRIPVGAPDAVSRLFRALESRGHARELVTPGTAGAPDATVVCAALDDPRPMSEMMRSLEARGAGRVLVMSRMGVHRDARASALRALWDVEEAARSLGCPALTLRIGPMVGATSPLWLKLASRPRLPRDGRQLLNPVCEQDVVETIDRALSGRAAWEGWYEVAGPEVWSLAELAALAGSRPSPGTEGHWEPPLGEMAEHRLAEAGPWLEHFGLDPTPIREGVGAGSSTLPARGVA
jgi:hypothetical protein